MPITNLGAQNSLSDLQLPTAYNRPSIVTFADFEYIRTVVLNIPKATVETATAQGTMLAIFNNATVGINKQIVDLIAAEFLATPVVTTFGSLISLTTNVEVGNFQDQTYLTNQVVAYRATVQIFVKSI
jgi:hypothetical protein